MTHTDPRAAERRVRVNHSEAARLKGVSTKTLNRWVEAGLVRKPEVVNKRRYYDLADIEGPALEPTESAA
jgi:predicted site-specific integrase-resolvase